MKLNTRVISKAHLFCESLDSKRPTNTAWVEKYHAYLIIKIKFKLCTRTTHVSNNVHAPRTPMMPCYITTLLHNHSGLHQREVPMNASYVDSNANGLYSLKDRPLVFVLHVAGIPGI